MCTDSIPKYLHFEQPAHLSAQRLNILHCHNFPFAPVRALTYLHGTMLLSMQIPVKFSPEEIQALLKMVENQLFRMKFIDTKLPGHRANPAQLQYSISAVNILKEAFAKTKSYKMAGAA